MSHLYLDDVLAQRLNNLIPENKDNTDETLRKIERFKRNIEIFKIHYGLDGKGGISLEKTGEIYGLTRESVRQITDKLSSSLNMNKKPLAIFDNCLSIINAMVPCKISRISKKLTDEGLIKSDFLIDGVVNSLRLFNLPLKAKKIVLANEHRFLVQDKFNESPKKILSLAIKHVSHNGAVSLALLSKEVPGINKDIKELYIKDVINTVEKATWITDSWVHFSDKGLNRLSNRLERLFSVYENVSINVIHQIIKRNWKKGSGKITSLLPKEVMLSFLLENKLFDVKEGMVTATLSKDWSIMSDTEKEMLDFIIASESKELREKDLEDKVVSGNPKKKYGFSQALNFSVLFHKKEWGLYTIPGELR